MILIEQCDGLSQYLTISSPEQAVRSSRMQRAIRQRAQKIRHPFSKISAHYATLVEKDCTSITPPYATLLSNLEHVRAILKRPLTLAEKFLYSHLVDPQKNLLPGGKVRGESYLQLRPQRVAMQDASAQYVNILHRYTLI